MFDTICGTELSRSLAETVILALYPCGVITELCGLLLGKLHFCLTVHVRLDSA